MYVNGGGALLNRIRGNSIYANAAGGIGLVNGGNALINSVTITSVSRTSDTVSGSGTSAGDVVCVYADDAAQARYFVGSVTASGGTWTLTGVDLGPYDGLNFTANRTTSTGNSSALSDPWADSIVVDTLTDVNDGTATSLGKLIASPGADGKISLREAITAADNQSGDKTITFSVAGTIAVSGSLDDLNSGGITIDGGGVIRIDGIGASGDGFQIVNSANNTLRGLTITRFPGTGIEITGSGSTGNNIEGCRIGTDGTADLGNGNGGVWLGGGANANTIGGDTPAERNIISGNATQGIRIYGSGTEDNLVVGNYIGTSAAGTSAIANDEHGVSLELSAGANIIGGVSAGEGNVISGNTLHGVRILGANGNFLYNNRIGLNAAGTAAVANAQYGIHIELSSTSNTIGGTGAGEGNVISGNANVGIVVNASAGGGNVIAGNLVGLNASGTAAVPNVGFGMQVNSGNNIIGPANVVSGHTTPGSGIDLFGGSSLSNHIFSNYIGTGPGGVGTFPNAAHGIVIRNGASNNTIGGNAPSEGNTIVGNLSKGVSVSVVSSVGNRVIRNRIYGNGEIPINLLD